MNMTCVSASVVRCGVKFFKQRKSCKTSYFNADKRDIRLSGGIFNHPDELFTRMFKIFFTFLAFYTIVENDIYLKLFEFIDNNSGFFKRFSSYKLGEYC